MRNKLLAAAAVVALALPTSAQDKPDLRSNSEAVAQTKSPAPSPNQIVDTASGEEWVAIPADDLLVMTLAPDAEGNPREVVIQLMPAPFSQGWVENIRTLARAQWYDGISVNRVQDNYVVQWGDPGYDNPESGETETKPLPEGLNVMEEHCYTSDFGEDDCYVSEARITAEAAAQEAAKAAAQAVEDAVNGDDHVPYDIIGTRSEKFPMGWRERDPYSGWAEFYKGWPLAGAQGPEAFEFWPVHCYGMVGVGRNYSPDTGSGAELYTVIGHAPRHLDRNIALVGRIISGIEHLSSLPRGSGVLGFYTEEEADKRTPILSVRVASHLPEGERPHFEYLSTESEAFARYAEARANRRDPFFIQPAGGTDICNIPVPIRPAKGD